MKVYATAGNSKVTLECSKVDLYNMLYLAKRELERSGGLSTWEATYSAEKRRLWNLIHETTSEMHRVADEEDALKKEYC